MKKGKNKPTKPIFRKVCNLRDKSDVYYTSSEWETKEIDGVAFIYVTKNLGMRDTPKLMRKDSVEYVK